MVKRSVDGGERRTFFKNETRFTDVFISNKVPINSSQEDSEGFFGGVYSVDVRLPGDDRVYSFALKEYNAALYGEDLAREYTRTAVENYDLAKQAGLQTWKTYRIGEDQKSILLSTGHTGEWKMFGYNLLTQKEREQMLPIENFDAFLRNYCEQGIKATEANIFLSPDAPFFSINGRNFDFVIGDLDLLRLAEKSESAVLLNRNVGTLFRALQGFFILNFWKTDQKTAETYIGMTKQYIREEFDLDLGD